MRSSERAHEKSACFNSAVGNYFGEGVGRYRVCLLNARKSARRGINGYAVSLGKNLYSFNMVGVLVRYKDCID